MARRPVTKPRALKKKPRQAKAAAQRTRASRPSAPRVIFTCDDDGLSDDPDHVPTFPNQEGGAASQRIIDAEAAANAAADEELFQRALALFREADELGITSTWPPKRRKKARR